MVINLCEQRLRKASDDGIGEGLRRMKNTKGKNNRGLLFLGMGILLVIAVVTIASMIFFKINIDRIVKERGVNGDSVYEAYYALVVADRQDAICQEIYQGAKAWGEENGIYVELFGENLATDYTKEDLMRIAIEAGVDGIIVEGDDSESLKALINQEATAEKERIPVVTVLSDAAQSDRKSFIGVSSYNLGKEYGRQVVKAAYNSNTNVMILMTINTEDSSQSLLYSGIKEMVDKEAAKRTINLEIKTIDKQGAFSTEETIRDLFVSQEVLPDIIICLDEESTKCVYQAVVDYNKVGTVTILGYFNSETIMKGIRRNVINASIIINTEQMGRYCVEALDEYKDSDNVSDYFAVQLKVITPENIDLDWGGDVNEE